MTTPREDRIQMYAIWLKNDVDGLMYQLRGPIAADEHRVLRDAHAEIKAALELVEHRIQHMETQNVAG